MERKLHRVVLVVHGRRKTFERDKKKRFKCACLSLHSFDFKHKANFEKKEKQSGDMTRVDEEGVKKGGQIGEGLITTLA